MQLFLIFIHNLLRWILLIFLISIIFKTYKKKTIIPATLKLSKFLIIVTHSTFLIGIYLLIKKIPLFIGFKEIMKDKSLRFLFIEHPIGMLISVILITIAHINLKKNNIKKATTLFIIALILIILSIPWPFRPEIGRSLIPNF